MMAGDTNFLGALCTGKRAAFQLERESFSHWQRSTDKGVFNKHLNGSCTFTVRDAGTIYGWT
jgi:hypothetical protein